MVARAESPSLPAEVRRLLGLALSRPIAEGDNPSRDADPSWDSLKHIEIVFLLEDHFELRFTDQELEQLQDAEQISRILGARLAA